MRVALLRSILRQLECGDCSGQICETLRELVSTLSQEESSGLLREHSERTVAGLWLRHAILLLDSRAAVPLPSFDSSELRAHLMWLSLFGEYLAPPTLVAALTGLLERHGDDWFVMELILFAIKLAGLSKLQQLRDEGTLSPLVLEFLARAEHS